MNIPPKKMIFSPFGEKIVKNFPHISDFQKWKNLSKLAFLWGKIAKICKFRGKNWKKKAG